MGGVIYDRSVRISQDLSCHLVFDKKKGTKKKKKKKYTIAKIDSII